MTDRVVKNGVESWLTPILVINYSLKLYSNEKKGYIHKTDLTRTMINSCNNHNALLH